MKYLLDANILIAAKNDYYPMDMMPRFWDLLGEKIQDGTIVILDKIMNEIIGKGSNPDDLETWISGLHIETIKSSTDEIRRAYVTLLRDLGSSPAYNSARAVTEWSDPKVADPWVIAAAKENGFTVVTLEKEVQEIPGNNIRHPKIPNFTRRYGVRTINLITMLRELGFSWR